jgi:hypothetical protein
MASVLTLLLIGLAGAPGLKGALTVGDAPSAATTVGGSAVAGGATAVDVRSIVGEWSAAFPWPVVAIHMHLLPNGRVLSWSDGLAYVWNPADGSFAPMPSTSTNLFCSGHSHLADGRLFVSGGHVVSDRFGSEDTNIFDPVTQTWSPGPQMTGGRWYPTNTTLANGDVLVVSGSITDTALNKLPQVYQPASGTFRNLTSAIRSTVTLYPYMFLAPNGKVFQAAPVKKSFYLSTTGTGKWTAGPVSNYGDRNYGTSVMYDLGKVLIAGGGGKTAGGSAPTNTAEVIDLNAASPTWRYTNPMAYGRRMLNSTLLPDGKVLVTGGTSWPGFNDARGSVYAAEMWDPATELWTTMASMHVRRQYHSTALLLPDGRILSAGGGRPAAKGIKPADKDHLDAEIYTPPYLFNADGTLASRSVITNAPTHVGYGQTFFVQTPNAAEIAKVTWLRLGSVTHDFNQDQRINRLTFSVTPGTPSGLDVTAPANANLAPPGHYMLFLVDTQGVPSVATIMQVE